jgi:hypothetical protein
VLFRAHLDGRDRVEKNLYAQEMAAVERPDVYMNVSADDKSALEEPKPAQSTGGGKKAFTRGLQGIHNEGTSRSYLTSVELGGGSKDASMEIALMLLHTITHQQTENIFMPVRDTASVGYCGSNIGALSGFMCDWRFFDLACPSFHFPRHGQMKVDELFGDVDSCWANEAIFNVDTMLLPLTSRQSCGSGGKIIASVVNPLAIDDIEPFLCSIYKAPFDSFVRLNEIKPLYWVYFGAHIKSKAEAEAVLPKKDGKLTSWGQYLLSFYPEGTHARVCVALCVPCCSPCVAAQPWILCTPLCR